MVAGDPGEMPFHLAELLWAVISIRIDANKQQNRLGAQGIHRVCAAPSRKQRFPAASSTESAPDAGSANCYIV